MEKQVNAAHYDFAAYVSKARWNSFYHQIYEIITAEPQSVLEVGIGPGVIKAILKNIGNCIYESMDIDDELKPDHIGSILAMPFQNNQYDVIGCFQVLEHLPYENFERALSELLRVAKKAVIISLPDAERVLSLHIPKICHRIFKWPLARKRIHTFDGEHYWEINKKGYGCNEIIKKIKCICKKHNYMLKKEYRVPENPYHHFFVLTAAAPTGSR
ncbi:MAG: class I SAM-dependent methyltransferase [Spirochaetaceae bacterium]|jgi:ubiquinone/menaquinone biosynthesis C-methylase UbiE|nr:class I SAM-dependent methyltransferase [Spirochaetaceae bacterium]